MLVSAMDKTRGKDTIYKQGTSERAFKKESETDGKRLEVGYVD